MATLIPRANIPNSQIGSLPGARPNSSTDRGAGLQLLSTAKKITDDLGAKFQEQEDFSALASARRELADMENSAFDPGNAEGISKYQGRNALGARALVEGVDSGIGEIRGRLTRNQQAKFDQVAGQFREGFAGRVNTRMAQEHEAFRVGEAKAALEMLGNDAVTAGVNGEFDQQDLKASELLGMVEARAAAEGWGDAQTAAAKREVTSNIRARTITGMATSAPSKAWEYYRDFGDELTAEDRERVERVIQPVVDDTRTTALTDAIMAGGSVEVAEEGIDAIDAGIEKLEGTGKNPKSSAVGVGQFLDSTWLDVLGRNRPDLTKGRSRAEILAMKTNPELGREMLKAYRRENAATLTANGVPLTGTNLYAAHHFGPGGGTKFARASNDTPMSQILSQKELAANEYLQGKTVGEVKQNWQNRGLVGGATVSGTTGAPPTRAEALAQAGKIKDADDRRRVMGEINQRFTIQEAQKQEAEKAQDEAMYTAISTNTDPNKSLLQVIGPVAYAQAEREGKVEQLDNLRTRTLTGQLTQDNPMLVDELSRELLDNPNAFMKRNLYAPEVLAGLSTDTRAKYVEAQQKLKDPSTRAAAQADWATDAQRVSMGLVKLGLATESDTKGTEALRKQSRGEFEIAYRNGVTAFMQGNKVKPTPTQLDAILNATVQSFGTRMKAGTLFRNVDGKQVGVYTAGAQYDATISQADRAALQAKHQELYGRPATDAWINKYVVEYRKGQAK